MNTEISNCYATGTVTNTNNSGHNRGVAGGVIGKTYWDAVVTNCYSTSEVNGMTDGGGIVGTAGFFDGGNNYIGGCIAWNDKVSAQNGEPGRVTGFMRQMTNRNRGEFSYAKSSMELLQNGATVEFTENAEFNTANTDARYEGISTDDIMSAARTIGWSDRHWDLSGTLPKLQWEKDANLPAVE